MSSINLRQFICAEFPSHNPYFAHGSAQSMEAAQHYGRCIAFSFKAVISMQALLLSSSVNLDKFTVCTLRKPRFPHPHIKNVT